MKKELLCISSIIVFTSLLSFFSVPSYNKAYAEENNCELIINDVSTFFSSPYLALKEASINGGTVRLLSDIDGDIWKDKITINNDINVIFDLNGYTYNEKIENDTFKRMNLGGTFTLKDGSIDKTGKWNYVNETDSDFNNKIVLSSTSNDIKLNIEGGYISNFASFVDAYSASNASINISGGIFDEPIFSSITKKINLNISGGQFYYHSEPIQIDSKGELNINISNSIKGLSLYCLQTNLYEKKMNINIIDDLVLNEEKIIVQIIHNTKVSLDGLIVASFSDNVLNKNISNFVLELNDTTNSVVKENVNDWKLVVIGSNLVLKNKDYNDSSTPNVSNKLILNDDKGNKLTFTNEYSGDLSSLENAVLVLKHLKKEKRHDEVIKNLSYKNYSIIDVIDTKIMKDDREVNLPNEDAFYVSISLNSDISSYDNYKVMDLNNKTYRATNNNGILSFETTFLGEYIILAKDVKETKYLLGAIIPLSIILILELGFIVLFHLKKTKIFKSKSIILLNTIWGGAIPIIVIESILVVLLGGYIIYILLKARKKNQIIKNRKE